MDLAAVIPNRFERNVVRLKKAAKVSVSFILGIALAMPPISFGFAEEQCETITGDSVVANPWDVSEKSDELATPPEQDPIQLDASCGESEEAAAYEEIMAGSISANSESMFEEEPPFPEEARICLSREEAVSRFLPTDGISAQYLRPSRFEAIMNYALTFHGWRYKWGGKHPSEGGFDCSGLVSHVYGTVLGIDINTNARNMYSWYCSYVDPSDAYPGDLVFWRGTYGSDVNMISHVGIYCGDGVCYAAGDPIGFFNIYSSGIKNIKGQPAQFFFGRINSVDDGKVDFSRIQASADSMSADFDGKTGQIAVTLSGIDCVYEDTDIPADVTDVLIPVWSDANGQDDIIWHRATNMGNGTYTVTTSAGEHRSSSGLYFAHAYVYSRSASCFAHSTQLLVEPARLTLSTELDRTNEKSARVTASGGAYALATAVSFPAWSEDGGQDDIVWYPAKRTDAGWEATVDVSCHRASGPYLVHGYAVVGGVNTWLGAASFEVTRPEASFTLSEGADGSIEVVLDLALGASPAVAVDVPVWFEEGERSQDDIVWHEAAPVPDGSGRWRVLTGVSEHLYQTGSYLAHAYVRLENGVYAFAGSARGSDGLPALRLEASPDEREVLVTAYISGGLSSLADSVEFAVWADARGQDDLRWYGGAGSAQAGRTASFQIASHADVGVAHVHAYGAVGGQRRFLGSTTYEVSAPVASFDVVRADGATGELVVEVGVSAGTSAIREVDVPLWFEEGARPQDDIVWYKAEEVSDGRFRVRTNIAGHLYQSGAFLAHAYVRLGNGVYAFAGGVRGDLSVPAAEMRVSLNADETEATVIASGGYLAFADPASVRFPVWSEERGQDDIVWYPAKQAGSAFEAKVPVSSHADAGTHFAHAYGSVGGAMRWAGSAAYEVSAPEVASLSLSAKDDGQGWFEETASGVSSKSGVDKVRFAVWSQPGQADIAWYDAERQSDGSWTRRVQAADHLCAEDYLVHVYVTAGNGVTAFGGTDNGEKLSLGGFVAVSGAVGSGSRTVMVKNPSFSVSSMEVATWSLTAGHDDLVWHQGSYLGDNLWATKIGTSIFRHSGQCYAQFYFNGNSSPFGTIVFEVSEAEIWRVSGDAVLDSYLRSVIDRYGTDLYTLYNYVASYRYIEGSKWPTGNWSIPFAKEMYQNGGGNCYRYAALFCWLAKAAGYDAGVVAGSCPRRGGGTTAHGWTEIYMNGQTYICDPDMQHEVPSRNWYMRTYSSAPMNYYK